MRAIFSRPTAGSASFTQPRHVRVLSESSIPTEHVPHILGQLRKHYGSKGFALDQVRTDGVTVYAVLVKDGMRMPVIENI